MQDLLQAKKKFGQLTWLGLGLCFVLLYSCPVKKFLIIFFDKPHAAKSASGLFLNNTSLQNVKIAYLKREKAKIQAIKPVQMVSPSDPQLFGLIPVSLSSCASDRLPALISLLQLSRKRSLADGPPRYLQDGCLL